MRLLAASAIVLAVGCSSGADKGPKLLDTDVAGSVVSVDGEVTARTAVPNSTKRTLAVGDDVMAGDVITTGTDATIKIRLAHNGAVVELAGDKTVALRKTAAWTAEAATAGALDQQGNTKTTVAGRHAEKEAAGTRATGSRAADDKPEVPRDVSTTEPKTDTAPPPPPPPPPDNPRDTKNPPKKGPKGFKKGEGKGPKEDGADPDDLHKDGLIRKKDKPSRSDISAAMHKIRGALETCGTEHRPAQAVTIRIKVTVAPGGKVSDVVASGTDVAPLIACIEAASRTATFPITNKGATFTYPIVVKP